MGRVNFQAPIALYFKRGPTSMNDFYKSPKGYHMIDGTFFPLTRDIRVITDRLGRKRIVFVIAHEIFHSLGLSHCNDKDCLMNNSISRPVRYALCKSCYKELNDILWKDKPPYYSLRRDKDVNIITMLKYKIIIIRVILQRTLRLVKRVLFS